MYAIPGACESIYIGQKGKTVSDRLAKHARYICLKQAENICFKQPEKSSLAEHYILYPQP